MTDFPSVLAKRANAFAKAIPGVKRGDVKAIHRARVATRRLREALPVVSSLTEGAARLQRDLRRVTRTLGPVRELDVARAVLAEGAADEAWPPAVVTAVDACCERRRDEAFRDATDVLNTLDGRSVRRRVASVAGRLDGSSAVGPTLIKQVRDRARAVELAIAHAGTLYSAPALHELRIAAKKLRYALELTEDADPIVMRRLKALQSWLGRIHDAQMLQHRVQELAASSRDRRLVADLGALEQSLERRCREWHGRVLKMLPRVAEALRAVMRDLSRTVSPRHVGRQVRMRDTAHARQRARIA